MFAKHLHSLALVTVMAISTAHAAAVPTGRIDEYVAAQMKEQHIPGLEVGIYRRGQVLLAKGYGLASVELNVPVRPEMVFQSGSVGKQFTATAIMMLVEEGKVNLEDSISRYFEHAPKSWQAIRIKHLLSHTSGLGEYESEERTTPFGLFNMRQDLSEAQLLERMETMAIDFAPGEKWRYTNTNFVLLSFVVHQVTGQFYGDCLPQRVFNPLAMASTPIRSDI